MFITCSKNVKITLYGKDGKKTESMHFPRGFVGNVTNPAILEHPYFKNLLKDHTITTVDDAADRAIRDAQEKALAEAKAKQIEAEKRADLIEAQSKAKEAALIKAEADGLDKTKSNALVKKMVAEATAEVEAKYATLDDPAN